MDSPPFRPKPIPAHLINGHSPLSQSSQSSTTDTATEMRDRKERDNLFSSIQASNRGRQVVDFDGPDGYFPQSSTSVDAQGNDAQSGYELVHGGIDVEGYVDDHSAKTPLATSRAHSPYTQHPTIDFDGLSWPSTYALIWPDVTVLTLHRQGNTRTKRSHRRREGTAPGETVRCCTNHPRMYR